MNRRAIIPWPEQILHLLLFAGAVYCALFLRGSAFIAYGALIAAPAAMLVSLIPFKYLPPALRQVLQVLLGAAALFWGNMRMGGATPSVDLTLVEIATVLGVALFIGRTRHEYSLLFFISIGFLGYGGLLPVRPYFLTVFIASVLMALAILYKTRAIVMVTGQDKLSDAPVNAQPPRIRLQFWPVLRHFLITLTAVLVMLHHLPQTRELKTKGLIPVSFTAEQPVEFPQLWEKWNKSASSILGGDAENNSDKDSQDSHKEKSPLQDDPYAPKIADAPQFPAVDARGGNGSWSSIGQGLVFRARTPAKLYWVMQMYDTYDGNQWTCSPSMLSTQTGPDTFKPVHEVEVPQHITMEAPESKLMPYQYRARHINVPVQDGHNDYGPAAYSVIMDKLTVKVRALKTPKLPWRYRVQSFVPNPEMKKPLRAWREPARNFGWNYRRLPEGIISKRLRDLAQDITKNAANPYEKAIAIRDFLRSNYTYSTDVPAVPDDKEVVDYFIFESKAGYCQHFAQAFTVLARLAGLHSRLVLGYAPGNYNLLTNTFEVFQYHAHAWTHIFAEPYGWLTFDGVAPGYLNIQNTPALLNNLIDPYDEAWKSRPPELTYIPPPPPEKSMVVKPEDNKPSESIADQIYEKAAEDNRTTDPNAAELGKAAAQLAWQSASKKAASVWEKITATIITTWKGVKNLAILALFALQRQSWPHIAILAFAIAALAGFYAKRHAIARIFAFLFRLYLCRRDLCDIIHAPRAPREQVATCHDIAIRMMKLANIKRQPRLDAAEWAASLHDTSATLADALAVIAQAAMRVQFSTKDLTPEIAQDVTEATIRLTHELSPFLSDAMMGKSESAAR